MNCPKDQTAMRERERETAGEVVVMDVCPSCGGIWLDKGELEKLTVAESRYYGERTDLPQEDNDDDEHGGGHGRGTGRGDRRGRRGGFFGNLFEGFGDD